MAPKGKKRTTRLVGRKHVIEGSDESKSSLKKKIFTQIEKASTMVPVEKVNTDLGFVPRTSVLPKIRFQWYETNDLDDEGSQHRKIYTELMVLLHSDDDNLDHEVVFELYLNLVVLVFPEVKASISDLLSKGDYVIEEVTWQQKKEDLEFEDEDLEIEECGEVGLKNAEKWDDPSRTRDLSYPDREATECSKLYRMDEWKDKVLHPVLWSSVGGGPDGKTNPKLVKL